MDLIASLSRSSDPEIILRPNQEVEEATTADSVKKQKQDYSSRQTRSAQSWLGK